MQITYSSQSPECSSVHPADIAAGPSYRLLLLLSWENTGQIVLYGYFMNDCWLWYGLALFPSTQTRCSAKELQQTVKLKKLLCAVIFHLNDVSCVSLLEAKGSARKTLETN